MVRISIKAPSIATEKCDVPDFYYLDKQFVLFGWWSEKTNHRLEILD